MKTDKAVRTPEKTSAGGTTLVPVDHGLEDVSEDSVRLWTSSKPFYAMIMYYTEQSKVAQQTRYPILGMYLS